LLRYSLGLDAEAALLERSVNRTIAAGILTPDLGGSAGTRAVGNSVVKYLREE